MTPSSSPGEWPRRISFGLNLALVAVLGGLLWSRTPAPRSSAAVAVAPPEPPSIRPAAGRAGRVGGESPAARRRSMIDQLRAMGVPNDLLALVARVDFEAQWADRFAACHGDMRKLAVVQLEMNRSKDAEMRAALGEKGFRQWDQKYMLWEAMSTAVPVTSAEADAIYALKKKLQQSQFTVEQARLDGTMDDAQINAAYDQAYAEFYRDLKGVLGDERYAKSQQLDDDFAAANLRHVLATVKPSDAQFQQLFDVEKAWRQSRSELDHQFQDNLTSPDYLNKSRALDEAHDLEYERILGADEFKALQKSQDPAYTEMKQFETLWGLDDAKIERVYGVLRQFQADVNRYRAQAPAAPAGAGANSAAIQALVAQTQARLREEVGDYTFEKLQRNHVLPFTAARPGPRKPF